MSNRKFLHHLVDVIWNHCYENKSVPSALVAEDLIAEAEKTFDAPVDTRCFTYFGGQKYRLIRCNCDCAMPCPQNKAGSTHSCAIWLAE